MPSCDNEIISISCRCHPFPPLIVSNLHSSIQLIQVLQPGQHHLLTRLLNLPGQKHLIQNRIHLIKIKHQIQFTHVPEKLVQHLDEEVDGLEVGELVVVGVDTRAEKQPRVPSVHDLAAAPELDEVALVFLVAWRHETMDFTFEPDFLVVIVGGIPFG